MKVFIWNLILVICNKNIVKLIVILYLLLNQNHNQTKSQFYVWIFMA